MVNVYNFKGLSALSGALALLCSLSCMSDDATVVDQVELDLDPAPSTEAPATSASPGSSAGSGSGVSSTPPSSEGGPSGAELETDETDEAKTPAAPAPAAPAAPPAPIEYWSDGVTVNGVSAEQDDRFHGVALDEQDNVYAVGYLGSGLGENRVMLVAKYDSSGKPVDSFGQGGRTLVDFSSYTGTPVSDTLTTADPSNEEARDVVLQSDGKIVVVGRSEDANDGAPSTATPIDIQIFRLDATGARDSSFGTLGVTTLNPGNGINELAWGVDIDASDRIYVFGHGTATNAVDALTPRTDQDRYVWRLNPDGTLDTTFGNQGSFTFDIPNGTTTLALNDNSRRGRVLPDGRIVTAGYTGVAGRNQVVLVKLLENGTPDTSFSTDGIVRLAPFATGMAEAYGVAFQSDGSFITTGYGNVDVERAGGAELLDMVSFRVRPDGTPDPSWGVGGAAVYNPGDAQDRGRDVTALPDDRMLYAGAATTLGTNKDAMLLLLDKNGAPAKNFDPAVHKAYDFGGDNEEFFSLQVSPSGKVAAAAGYATGVGLANGNGVLAIVPIGK
jgi:uncharacterized delta-60 repeat protein